ncbi:MAG: hypothetical protein JJ901_14300 [Erythrobacter sp.]|uniref:hypothetical protein n=1 Tax=Erythrobacter sp. TaxID=1042 RepID=UPI001B24F3AF|nr:hypothetical protein [Erythrobacter sp.]MBO6769459.1 hypothetical protein [Erythrobacter sp.]
MTLSFSLPSSNDTSSILAGLDSESGRKSTASEGADGFADLLNNLASIVPSAKFAPGKTEGEGQGRQTSDLPTGKSLPVAMQELPVGGDGEAGTDGNGAEIATVIPFASLTLAATPIVLKGSAATVSVSPEGGETTATPAPMLPTLARVAGFERQEGTPTTHTPATKGQVAAPSGEPKGDGLQVRISAASEPRDARITGAMPALESGKARVELPAAASPIAARVQTTPGAATPVVHTGASAETLAGEKPQSLANTLHVAATAGRVAVAPSTRLSPDDARVAAKPATIELGAASAASAKPETAAAQQGGAIERPAAAVSQPVRASELAAGASTSDRSPGEDSAAADKAALAPRATAGAEGSKPMPQAQALAAPVDGLGTAARPLASATPQAVVNDPFADVERVVEHLMAARQVDLSKPAAIAVAHREFGALTVTFDQSAAGGMNVEIAAESSEAQRALAAAMANDRGATRQQDSVAQPNQAQNQPAPTTSERGGSANSGGSSLANGGADEQRSSNSDQRRSHGDRAASQPHAPPQAPSDDALYA